MATMAEMRKKAKALADLLAEFGAASTEPMVHVKAILPRRALQLGADLLDCAESKRWRAYECTHIGRTLVTDQVWSSVTVRVEPMPADELVSPRLFIPLAHRHYLIDEPIVVLARGPTTYFGRPMLITQGTPIGIVVSTSLCEDEHEWTEVEVDLHGWELSPEMAVRFNPECKPFVAIEP